MGVSFDRAQKIFQRFAEYTYAQALSEPARMENWWAVLTEYFANPPTPPAPTDEAKAAALEWVRNSAFAWVSEDQLWECQECSEAGRTMDLTTHRSTCIVGTLEAALSAPTETREEERVRVLAEIAAELGELERKAHKSSWCISLYSSGGAYLGNGAEPGLCTPTTDDMLSALDAELAKCREKQEPQAAELSPWVKVCIATMRQMGLSEAEKAQLRAAVDGGEEKGQGGTSCPTTND